MIGQKLHYSITFLVTRPSTLALRLLLQLLPQETQQFVKLTLHSNHLLAHVKSDLGSL